MPCVAEVVNRPLKATFNCTDFIFFWTNNKANIFLGLIEYELSSLLGASHLAHYISVHIRFDLESYLLTMY